MKIIAEIKRPMEINDTNSCQQEEDEYLQLQNIIEIKRNILLEKQRKIQKIAKQNAFLEDIKNDYYKYNSYIIKQKQDQMTALQLLNNYIDGLNRSGQLSEQNIYDSKMEQKKIVRELKAIRQGLDKIMNDSNEINSILVNREREI
jgi:hypothetical protein